MRAVLFSLSASALYAIFYFSYANGLHELGHKAVASGKLPGVNAPLRTVYTGFEPVDRLLALLTTFFYPALDGQNATLLLHSIGFSGTFGAAWMLIVLESWRKGNSGTVAAYPAIFGLAAQVFTFAFATPLLCALQLGCSVTASRPHAENIRVPRAVLAALPAVFVVGFMVPTQFMVLPAPAVLTVDLKQIAIALWQPWPAYVSILTTAAYYLLSPFYSNNKRAAKSALRWVYAFAFGHAALAHLVTWIVSLTTIVAPALFDARFVDALHPSKVFSVPLPWSGLKIDTVSDGVHVFLRWDYMIGSAGVLIWAISLYTVAHKQILSTVAWPSLLLKIVLLAVVAGPTGAAVELIWERDELVFNETGGNKQQVTKGKKSS
ncbi:hypothetical protein N7468_002126 [Penicillium chermesinum]|uniref:Uncharacterized protein n=1 Tax=Penicillium chermesinum TaxID=63820 RepID=A0A9W9PHX5_9EURO|nr:uncharacterized protein N7468_002126 [Penicillium chermesinum]KAJ5247143.1 hypothetical protein N7468_002126 [Penicillium chermesinum]KAJ6145388.1 hypothetical protein N7470_009283 [Penicillium chermesinum]